jgi:hypothetical protein
MTMNRTGCLIISSVLSVCCLPLSLSHAQVTGQEILQKLGIPQNEVDQLEDGAILSYSDAEYESTSRELAADAIILVKSDLAAVREALRGATTLIPTKLILEDADILSEADFADIKFADEDFEEVERLFKAKPGKDFNFSNAEYAALNANLAPHKRSSRADKIQAASAAMREILRGRYNKYRASGLNGIEGYQRSRRKQVDIGRELRLTTDTFEPFAEDFPEFYEIMAQYPNGQECCESYFRWLKVDIRKRPTFALSHTVIQQTDEFILYTERHFYASNQLNSVQITLSWFPYGEQTYMGIAMSASADILDSMMGKMLRPLGRNKAKDLVTDVMVEVRDDLDSDDDEGDNER